VGAQGREGEDRAIAAQEENARDPDAQLTQGAVHQLVESDGVVPPGLVHALPTGLPLKSLAKVDRVRD
jgi:hypothetical protein